MYLGRQRAEWERHSQMMALHLNLNRKHGTKPVSPDKLNPYAFARPAKPRKLSGEKMLSMLTMLCPAMG